jgi:putative AlgH/UPF0301 family transcriptional regulator
MRSYIYFSLAAICMVFPGVANRYDGRTGEYLVAFHMAPGEYFENSVVYVADHKFMGALGFRLGLRLDSEALKDVEVVPSALKAAKIPVFEGGPVQDRQTLMILERKISGEGEPNWQAHDYKAYAESYRGDLIADIIASYKDDAYPDFWLFLGFSRWVTSQLEFEVMRDTWVVAETLDMGLNSMLNHSEDALWHKAFEQSSKESKKKLGKIY